MLFTKWQCVLNSCVFLCNVRSHTQKQACFPTCLSPTSNGPNDAYLPLGAPITPGAKTSAPLSTARPHCRSTTTFLFCWVKLVWGPREGMTMTSVSAGWGRIDGGGRDLSEYCCVCVCVCVCVCKWNCQLVVHLPAAYYVMVVASTTIRFCLPRV